MEIKADSSRHYTSGAGMTPFRFSAPETSKNSGTKMNNYKNITHKNTIHPEPWFIGQKYARPGQWPSPVYADFQDCVKMLPAVDWK